MRFIVNQRRNHVGARTDQMNKRQKTAQYRRYIDFGELLKLDNNRLDKKTLHKNARIYASVGICCTTPVMIEKRMVFRLKDRMVIRYGVVKPLPVSFKRWKLLLVESMLDVGDVLSSVAGRS